MSTTDRREKLKNLEGRQRRRKGEVKETIPLFARVPVEVYLAIDKLGGTQGLAEGLERLLELAHIKDSDSTI